MSFVNIALALWLLQVALTGVQSSSTADFPHTLITAAFTILDGGTADTPYTPAKESGKRTTTTVFWVGEEADSSNDYIANDESAWDRHWEEHFGGYDDPSDRCGYQPCEFTPDENPFYVALPYDDLKEDGTRKSSSKRIPWYDAVQGSRSIVKDHWVRVIYKGRACYGQWEDVGPNETDDFTYVFGSKTTPKNTFDERAGLDISPALRDCLGVSDVSITSWSFVDNRDVPDGPWMETVTGSAGN